MAPPTTLPTRMIGDTPVSAMGFGAMGFSAFYVAQDKTDEGRLKVLDAVYESGCTFWDTSDVYGDNEDILSEWFARTGKIFLAKFGLSNGDPVYVRTAFENSCRRLCKNIGALYIA